jgi:hypothetical protein
MPNSLLNSGVRDLVVVTYSSPIQYFTGNIYEIITSEKQSILEYFIPATELAVASDACGLLGERFSPNSANKPSDIQPIASY